MENIALGMMVTGSDAAKTVPTVSIAMKCQNCNDQGCHLGGCQYCYLCAYCMQGGFCDEYCKQAKIPYVKEWPKASSSKSGNNG